MSELGDWYANFARMPVRTRLMSVLLYTVAGALGFVVVQGLTGGPSVDSVIAGGFFGVGFGALTVFVFPTVVVLWRRRQGS